MTSTDTTGFLWITRPVELRIRRLGVRIPPSAQEKCRSEAVFARNSPFRRWGRENNPFLTVLRLVLRGCCDAYEACGVYADRRGGWYLKVGKEPPPGKRA